MIIAMEKVEYILPTWIPLKPIAKRYLESWPYHDPQTTNWRNIITESCIPVDGFIILIAGVYKAGCNTTFFLLRI